MADVDFLGYARAAQQQQGNPVKDFIQGYGAVGDLRNQVMRGNLLGLELEKAQRQQEALKGYGATGDIQGVMQKDPMLALKLTEAQFGIANAVSKYWDNTKAGLTRETYGPWRADLLKKFPGINPSQFPDPSSFKTDEDFTKFKYEKELKNAEFKRMSGQPKISGGFYLDPVNNTLIPLPERPMTEYQKMRIEQGERGLGIRQQEADIKGTKTPKISPYQDFKDGYLEKNPNASTQEIIREYNKTVYEGRGAGQATKPPTPKQKADAALAEQKARLMQKLGGGEETPTTAPGGNADQYYQSFKKALQGPNKQTAIERAYQSYPQFLDRAKKEGLL